MKKIICFFLYYLGFFSLDAVLPIDQNNQEYHRAMLTVSTIIKDQKEYGVLYNIYKNFFELLPAVFKLENNVTNFDPLGRTMALEKLVGFNNNMDLQGLLDLKLSYGYYETVWEDTKTELALVWMKRILDRLTDIISISITTSDIFKKIHKGNYKYKNLFISQDISNILEKIEYVLTMKSRQRLVYIVGKPGTGKTTIMINELVRLGYTVYYVNGNSILLSDHKESTIIQVLDQLKREILLLPMKQRDKTVIIFDECEVAVKDVGQLDKLLDQLRDSKDIVAKISENQIQKEKALTSFMLYMFSMDSLSVICISNSLNISPYMQRRITYLVNFSMDTIEDYITMWKQLLYKYNLKFKEDNISDIIYEISLFSLKKKVSIRTIKQFTSLFSQQTISVKTLFEYCERMEE